MRALCVVILLLSQAAFAKGIFATMSMAVGNLSPDGEFQVTQAARPTMLGVFCFPSPLFKWAGAENRLEFRTDNQQNPFSGDKKMKMALDIDFMSQSACYVQVEYIMQHNEELELHVVMTKDQHVKEVRYCLKRTGACSVAPANLK